MRYLIPSIKGSFLPCCYFPTHILLVDDNPDFLQSFQQFLGNQKNTKTFDNYSQFFDFLKQHKSAKEASISSYLSLKEGDADLPGEPVDIQYARVAKILRRKDRFGEISVVVVDYEMPGMNGIEVAKKIKELFPNIKVIMLTGEADEQIAINAFNDGIIDKFIKKNAKDYLQKVREYIDSLQIKYFQNISKTIAEAFKARKNTILEEPDFIHRFNQICQENNIIEYYLLEGSGSFVLLNEEGNIIRIIVKSSDDMKTLYEIALHDNEPSQDIIKKLKDRKGLVYFHNKKSELAPSKDWRLEEAQTIKGQQTYYYAIINGTKTYPFSTKDILTYAEYLQAQEK